MVNTSRVGTVVAFINFDSSLIVVALLIKVVGSSLTINY